MRTAPRLASRESVALDLAMRTPLLLWEQLLRKEG
jgi:hypothetical protein